MFLTLCTSKPSTSNTWVRKRVWCARRVDVTIPASSCFLVFIHIWLSLASIVNVYAKCPLSENNNTSRN